MTFSFSFGHNDRYGVEVGLFSQTLWITNSMRGVYSVLRSCSRYLVCQSMCLA